jgi:hypothetical protein
MSAAILPYWPFLGKQSSALDVLSPQASKTSFCPPCTVSAAWQPWSFFLDNLPPAGHYFWRQDVYQSWHPRDMALYLLYGIEWTTLSDERWQYYWDRCWFWPSGLRQPGSHGDYWTKEKQGEYSERCPWSRIYKERDE